MIMVELAVIEDIIEPYKNIVLGRTVFGGGLPTPKAPILRFDRTMLTSAEITFPSDVAAKLRPSSYIVISIIDRTEWTSDTNRYAIEYIAMVSDIQKIHNTAWSTVFCTGPWELFKQKKCTLNITALTPIRNIVNGNESIRKALFFLGSAANLVYLGSQALIVSAQNVNLQVLLRALWDINNAGIPISDKTYLLMDRNRLRDGSATDRFKTRYMEGAEFTVEDYSLSYENIVNQIKLYGPGTQSGSTVLLTTRQNAASIAKYGLREKSIQLPISIPVASAEWIADGLLREQANPVDCVKVKDLKLNLLDPYGQARIYSGYMGITLYPRLQRENIISGSSVSSVNTSTATGMTVHSLPRDQDYAFTGIHSASLRVHVLPGATGYIRIPVAPTLMNPSALHFRLRSTSLRNVRVHALDEEGSAVPLDLPSSTEYGSVSKAVGEKGVEPRVLAMDGFSLALPSFGGKVSPLSYLNEDPNTEVPSAWEGILGATAYEFIAVDVSPMGTNRIGSLPGSAAYVQERRRHALDRTARYKVRAWFAGAGATGLLYMCLREFRADGTVQPENSGLLNYKIAGRPMTDAEGWVEFEYLWEGSEFRLDTTHFSFTVLLNYTSGTVPAGVMTFQGYRLSRAGEFEPSINGVVPKPPYAIYMPHDTSLRSLTAIQINAPSVSSAEDIDIDYVDVEYYRTPTIQDYPASSTMTIKNEKVILEEAVFGPMDNSLENSIRTLFNKTEELSDSKETT